MATPERMARTEAWPMTRVCIIRWERVSEVSRPFMTKIPATTGTPTAARNPAGLLSIIPERRSWRGLVAVGLLLM